MADATDELYTLKQLFHLGSYREALDEAASLKLKAGPAGEAARLERDVLVLRSQVGLGLAARVAAEGAGGGGGGGGTAAAAAAAAGAEPVALQAVRALARYLSAAAPERRAEVVAQFEAWTADAAAGAVPAVQALGATVFLHEQQPLLALRALRGFATLEALALSIEVYLRMDRVDLAERQLRALQERDDESALFQLSAAHVCLALGGDKYREALSTLQEVLQRYGEDGTAVTAALSAALVCLRRFDEAERLLKEALAKEPAAPELLINLLALMQHTGRGLGVGAAGVADGGAGEGGAGGNPSAKVLATLQRVAPGHPFVAALGLAESSFDRIAAGFAAAATSPTA
jgi:coatomer protein complex subunit epsilon